MKFEVTILGCGAALPARGRNTSAQVINIHEQLFLMDCGEGTQQKLRLNKIKMQRISHIFISHLHGDHYLGLMGLISSFNLLGRQKPLTVIGPEGLQEVIELQMKLAKSYLQFELNFQVTDHSKSEVVADLPHAQVVSFPLDHRVPTTGFLFKEQQQQAKIDKKAIVKYDIGIRDIHLIKAGGNHTLPNGDVIPHSSLTFPAPAPRSYAYCSDTKYFPEIVQHIKEVDLLYHESTFVEADLDKAVKTKHSTARQAAEIAKQAKVRHLLLGHFSARYANEDQLLAEAKEVFEQTSASEEDSVYKIEHGTPISGQLTRAQL